MYEPLVLNSERNLSNKNIKEGKSKNVKKNRQTSETYNKTYLTS